MKGNRILMIYKGPLGTLTDNYKWCYYLRNEFDITFVELAGPGHIDLDGINIITVSNKGNRVIRGLRFILTALVQILFFKGLVIVFYFDGCSIFKRLLPWKKMILDIRTLSVEKNKDDRERGDEILRQTCFSYDFITIIQKDLINKLSIDERKVTVIPLGADVISNMPKTYDALRLLYVGTLDGRRIDETIKGVALFKERHPEADIVYTIVGDGVVDHKEQLESLVSDLDLENVVNIVGRVPYNKLQPFFDKSNIGVSYVPKTDWYEHQPPTKTFEYIMSGLYCIGTSTSENGKIINNSNGILHNDNPNDFAIALETIYVNRNMLSFTDIHKSLLEWQWSSIVNLRLIPFLRKL